MSVARMIYPVVVLWGACACTVDAQPRYLSSWQSLEQLWVSAAPVGDPVRAIEGTAGFQTIAIARDVAIYREMLSQVEYPFVRLAGFLAMRQVDERAAVAAGLWLAVAKDMPRELLLPVYELIGKRDVAEEVASGLQSMLEVPLSRRGDFALITTVVSIEALQRVSESVQFDKADVTSVALIVGRLLDEQVTLPGAERLVARFAEVPGIPRLMYVTHSGDRNNEFRHALVDCLADATIPDLHIALLVHRLPGEVRAVRPDTLALGERRMKVIKEALAVSEAGK